MSTKKVTLKEAYEQSVKLPLEIGFNGMGEPIITSECRNVASLETAYRDAGLNAVLLAHAFNVLPEVVVMVARLAEYISDSRGDDPQPPCERDALTLLAKTSTVEVSD